MIKKLCIITLISALMFNLSTFAKENQTMTNTSRQEIADKNLEILFNITTKNNNGADKDFMNILQKYIFGEVFTIGDLDMKTRELLTVTSLTVMQTLPQLKAHINGALNEMQAIHRLKLEKQFISVLRLSVFQRHLMQSLSLTKL